MKKIIFSLSLLSIFAYSSEAMAKLDASGLFLVTGQFANQLDLEKSEDKPTYKVYERIEIGLNLAIEDNINGGLKVRLPHNGKGQFGSSSFSNNDAFTPDLIAAYASFPFAHTPITMTIGMQEYMLPAYLGGNVNPVFDSHAAGIVLNGNLGMMRPTFAWFVLDYPASNETSAVSNLFALSVPLSLAEDMQINPWFAINESNSGIMYLGVTSKHVSDNLIAGADFLYGQKDIAITPASSLLVDVYASLALDKFTPGVMAWYSTGKRGENIGLSEDYNTITQGTWASFNGQNSFLFANDNSLMTNFSSPLANPFGTVGLGLSASNIYLTKETNLSLQALYIAKTDEDSSDSILEFGANMHYAMFKALDILLDMNYAIPMYSDTSTQGNGFNFATSVNINF